MDTSFKFVATGDLHLGLTTFGVDNGALNTRSADAFQALDQLIDFSIDNNIKLITMSGDIFNNKTVPQTVVVEFYKRVQRISDSKIDLVILSGNHDKSTRQDVKCSLDLMNVLKIPHVYETDGNEVIDLGYIQIFTAGYYYSNEELEQQLDKFAQEIDWKRPSMLLGHLQVETPQFANASFKEDLHLTPMSLLIKYPFQFVSLGHLHRPVELNSNPPVHYNGSLVRCSFAEEADHKGFNVVEVNGIKPIKITRESVRCLKMLTLKGTMEELRDSLAKAKPELFENTIVRVIVNEAEEVMEEKWLKDKFKFAFRAILTKESKKSDFSKVENVKTLSINDALNKFFDDQPDKEDLLALVEELKQIDDNKVER
jgi:exonuclease SbcD